MQGPGRSGRRDQITDLRIKGLFCGLRGAEADPVKDLHGMQDVFEEGIAAQEQGSFVGSHAGGSAAGQNSTGRLTQDRHDPAFIFDCGTAGLHLQVKLIFRNAVITG